MRPTKEQLDNMSDDELFALLDKRTDELKEISKPLGVYQTKRYAAISKAVSGEELDDKTIQVATKIGKENYRKIMDKIIGDD
jgi:hypothetical protein